ncbi:flagellar biosynthetic protein FliO [Brucella sp. H1_1004]|uniref:flagellar biosynthetic protein FliO n=1 Tax=Brucella sp. H1_1004 TaxID=3110109 RepID=UPI0039B3C5FF
MKEWLSGLVGESAANIIGFILIFAIILGGIFVVLSIIRRFSGSGFSTSGRTGRQPRLSVMDAAAVDGRRKLVLIRRDDVEHLLLIGGPNDVVVEQNIVMEARANPRLQSSRIEPEHIERFRQHEASVTSDVAERPALAQPVAQVVEKDEAIQLNSPIEPVTQRKPEPVQQIAPEAQQFRAPPRLPVAPPVTPVAPHAPQKVEAPARPQPPRPAPNYPPQPRTVLPAARPSEQPQSPRLHPAYPLSQVSRGVLSSTSAASAAAAASVAAANLGNVTPANEQATIPLVAAPEVSPAATIAPAFKTEPEPIVSTAKEEPFVVIASEPEPQFEDDLGDIGGALHDAIMADLATDGGDIAGNKEPEMLEIDIFEEELLGSLDISPNGNKPDDSIEDEMEKLLGELTSDETRKF